MGLEIADGRWRLTESLRGDLDRGQFRATGDGTALVTSGSPQKDDDELFVDRLRYEVPNVVPLLWSGSVTAEGVRYDVLVEVEPAGITLDQWQGSDAAKRRIALQLANVVCEAGDHGVVLGGLRPELVYIDGNALSGIAPRCEVFLAHSTERCYGVGPCFEQMYLAPEQVMLHEPGPPADVFALGGVLAFLFTGTPPFGGSSVMERLAAVGQARHGPLDAAGDLAPLLSRMMDLEGAGRPEIEEVVEALSAQSADGGASR
jgi:hypothetical protein